MDCNKQHRNPLNMNNLSEWFEKGAMFSSAPGKILIAWGHSSWHEAPSPDGSTWYYFPDFFLKNQRPWLHFEKSAMVDVRELSAIIETIPTDAPSIIKWENRSKVVFDRGFDELQRLFNETELSKVVLYILSKSSGPLTSGQRKRALSGILKYVQEAPVFAYGFWDGSQGILGATPEILFRTAPSPSRTLETMALAGTEKTSSLSQKMLHDKKLLHEFDIVVEDIAARLLPFGKVTIGPLQVLSLPVLSHIYRPISAQLNQEYDFLTLTSTLHPTSALGGFPKDVAMKWLKEYDQLLPRGRFGAPAGFWDSFSGQKTCYVAIRNVLWNETELAIGAGCGIVPASSKEKEWEEVLLKTQSIIRFLQL